MNQVSFPLPLKWFATRSNNCVICISINRSPIQCRTRMDNRANSSRRTKIGVTIHMGADGTSGLQESTYEKRCKESAAHFPMRTCSSLEKPTQEAKAGSKER